MPITDIQSLRLHLQWAIEVEHTQIPAYLCALYSIKEGHNREAAEIIESVFMEEMLHFFTPKISFSLSPQRDCSIPLKPSLLANQSNAGFSQAILH